MCVCVRVCIIMFYDVFQCPIVDVGRCIEKEEVCVSTALIITPYILYYCTCPNLALLVSHGHT